MQSSLLFANCDDRISNNNTVLSQHNSYLINSLTLWRQRAFLSADKTDL